MLFGQAFGLIDRLKSHQTALASQLRSNLQPQVVKLVLNLLNIGSRSGEIKPLPGIMMDIHNDRKAARRDLIDYSGDAFQPLWCDFEVWSRSNFGAPRYYRVESDCRMRWFPLERHTWETNTLKSRCFDVIESLWLHSWVVPRPFVRHCV